MYALVKTLNPVLSLANVDDVIQAKLKVTNRTICIKILISQNLW